MKCNRYDDCYDPSKILLDRCEKTPHLEDQATHEYLRSINLCFRGGFREDYGCFKSVQQAVEEKLEEDIYG